MCGIIGVVKPESSLFLYPGLYTLQHRGQDSCGILTFNNSDNEFHSYKMRGIVSNVFSEGLLRALDGDMGIGHVRYPTVGANFSRDAQPLLIEKPKRFGIAHNGNIANFMSLGKEFECKMKTTCDSELIMHLMAEKIKDGVFPAVENVMNRVNGAYSVVAMVPEVGIVAYKDPFGIRPLELSENGVASESVALDVIDEKWIGEVRAGECVIINEDGIERKQLRHENPRPCMFEWVYFSRPDSIISGISVYRTRYRLGKELAKNFDKKVDVVVPVPDTSRVCALGFSEEAGVPLREGFIKNRYVYRTFIMPTQNSRTSAVGLKLNPIRGVVKGKSVALLDDSIVRGTTCGPLVKLMRKAGAKEVHLIISCPPVKWPCFYGIDMTQKKELIAAQLKDVEKELAERIGADSVTYQTIEGLTNAIGTKDLCMGCLNGDYPTDVSKQLALQDKGKRPYEVNE